MELEEAIKELENIRDFGNDTGFAYSRKNTIRLQKSIETVLKALENSVSKDVIKNRIKELEDIIDKYIKAKEYNQADLQLCKKRVLQELL